MGWFTRPSRTYENYILNFARQVQLSSASAHGHRTGSMIQLKPLIILLRLIIVKTIFTNNEV
jgi:hypothetical protein